MREDCVCVSFSQAPAGLEIKWLLSLPINRFVTYLKVHCYKTWLKWKGRHV